MQPTPSLLRRAIDLTKPARRSGGKKLLFILVPASLIFAGCSKDSKHVNNNTDSTSNQAIDTSYLKKTERQYVYNQDGVTINDSNYLVWRYDVKGRPVSEVITKPGYYDSISTVYTVNPETIRAESYFIHTMMSQITQTFYRTGNVLDSMTTKGYSASGLSVTNYDQTTTYGYDEASHDTLETCIEYITGTAATQYIRHSIYTSSKLDSVVTEYPGQHAVTVSSYKDGAQTKTLTYQFGQVKYIDLYSYNNIPSGGYYGSSGSPYLISQLSWTYGGASQPAVTETLTYELDKQNRVVKMSSSYSPAFQNVTEYYTY